MCLPVCTSVYIMSCVYSICVCSMSCLCIQHVSIACVYSVSTLCIYTISVYSVSSGCVCLYIQIKK